MDEKLPVPGQRHLIALWGFTFTALMNLHRQTMSVAMVAMVNNTEITESHHKNNSEESCILYSTPENVSRRFQVEGEFHWDSQLQGNIIAVFCFSYIISQFFGGRIAEMWGSKRIVIFSAFFTAVLTIIVPFSAWWNFYALIIVQLTRGFAMGFICPAFYVAMANWFPRKERGLLSSCTMNGFTLGALLGALVTGWLCNIPELGWPAAYYVTGGVNCLLCIPFGLFFYESPKDHPHITKKELNYIISDQESDLAKKRPPIPWKAILTSIPVYAVSIGMFGLYWSINHFLAVHPTYLGAVLHYNMAQNGLLTSMPNLAMILATFVSSFGCNFLTKKDLLSVNTVRKGCNLISAVGFSACLVGVILAKCDRMVNMICFTTALLFCGMGFSGSLIVCGDMSPTYAGTLFGISGAFACLATALLPVSVGALTKTETLEEWHHAFYMHIGVVLSCALIFQVFGSAEIQKWNSPESTGKSPTCPS